ncbi:hypothetical protein HMSSN036_76500 [Paenibacillus macerans]|nr:hypothetical protein HMSSN036_76500 [Paenibacillus macerans]
MKIMEQTSMGRIWSDKPAKSVLFKYFPFLAEEEHIAFTYKMMTLGQFLERRMELGFPAGERGCAAAGTGWGAFRRSRRAESRVGEREGPACGRAGRRGRRGQLAGARGQVGRV